MGKLFVGMRGGHLVIKLPEDEDSWRREDSQSQFSGFRVGEEQQPKLRGRFSKQLEGTLLLLLWRFLVCGKGEFRAQCLPRPSFSSSNLSPLRPFSFFKTWRKTWPSPVRFSFLLATSSLSILLQQPRRKIREGAKRPEKKRATLSLFYEAAAAALGSHELRLPFPSYFEVSPFLALVLHFKMLPLSSQKLF